MTLSWPLIAYVMLGVACAGTLGTQGVLALRGRGGKVHLYSAILALVLCLGAMAAAVARLGRVDRVFNVLAHLSSGISQGYAVLIVFAAAAVVAIVAIHRDEDNSMPRWCGVMCVIVALLTAYGIAANLTATGLHAGKTLLATAYLVAAALAAGFFVMSIMFTLCHDESCPAPLLALGSTIASAATGILAYIFATIAPTLGIRATQIVKSDYGMVGIHPTQGINASVQNDQLVLWVLALVVGALVPLVISLIARKIKGAGSAGINALGVIAVLVGVAATVSLALFSGQAVQLLSR